MNPARRITIILSSIAALCGALGIAQKLGMGDGYSLLPASGRTAKSDALSALDKAVFKLPSWGDYALVLEHPVFNESREPTPIDEKDDPNAGPAQTATPINVTLTSIIITPKLKLAIVRDNNTGQSTVVKVGNTLEGEQSGWKLVEVAPRKAVFEGQGLGQQELELLVDASAKGAAPPMPGGPIPQPGMPGANPAAPPLAAPPPATMATMSDNQVPDANNQARAEEIRKRIEERRKQLREEAERMRSQENSQ